jgi:hypothetical protein
MQSHSSIPFSPTKPPSSATADSTLTPSPSIKKPYSQQRGAGILLDPKVGAAHTVPIVTAPIPKENEGFYQETAAAPDVGHPPKKDTELSTLPTTPIVQESEKGKAGITSDNPTTPVTSISKSTSIPIPIVTNLSSQASPSSSRLDTASPNMASTEPLSLGAPVSNEKTTAIDSTATGDPVLQAASIAHPSSETHKLAEQKVIGQELTKDGVVGNEKTDGGLGEVVVHVSQYLGSGGNQMQLRGSVAVGKDELKVFGDGRILENAGLA